MTSYTTGPGSLVLGETGSSQEIAAQVTSCTVEWDVEDGEVIDLLSGGQESDEDTYSFTLSGNLLQDITETGITTWSWTNKGETVPFTFVPNTALGRAVTGEIKVRPLAVGGDAKKKAQSDFEFAGVGEPDLGDVAP